ncbi:hypothetical protein GCM10010317_000410 [Streptomyces mirabilis]|uniref:hypothetical protein n=1 Tax=Streptomyces mirabilis TaxID=68239 RepID=UPI0019BCB7D6|nr:hypothetical protein [Streptomyces mirabilis]GHD36265.1 hypothetical protein GCM10010317_000410 [Streptomyces mirabilis]
MTVSNVAFTGKVAFVTGAGSGIGRTTALADRSPDGLRETARAASTACRPWKPP